MEIHTVIHKTEYWPSGVQYTPSVLLGLILSLFFSEGEILEVCYILSYSGSPGLQALGLRDCIETAKRNVEEKLGKKKKGSTRHLLCYSMPVNGFYA